MVDKVMKMMMDAAIDVVAVIVNFLFFVINVLCNSLIFYSSFSQIKVI